MADFTRFDTSRRLAIGLLMAMAILLSGCNAETTVLQPLQPTVDTCEIKPEAQCPNADLGDADLHDANLSDADLREANLAGADLSEAFLSDAHLRLARHNADTKWPEGFDPRAAGAWLVEDDD